MDLASILSPRGLSLTEYAVLWHVRDTVVANRDSLARWVAENAPNFVASSITVEDCLRAIASLHARGLLIELSEADLEADLARWRAEPLPVSFGVDRDRVPGDVDLTEAGFRTCEEIVRLEHPDPSPRRGYNDETPGVIRAFGETEPACRQQAASILDRVHDERWPWRWPAGSTVTEPMRELGPWWHSRFELVPRGFELVVRRAG